MNENGKEDNRAYSVTRAKPADARGFQIHRSRLASAQNDWAREEELTMMTWLRAPRHARLSKQENSWILPIPRKEWP